MTQKDYAKDFDESVINYNDWLEKGLTTKDKIKIFLKGMSTTFAIMDQSLMNQSSEKYFHPVYSRKDLNHTQKDAISLASDFKRVEMTLDKIIAGEKADDITVDQAIAGKKIVEDMYNNYKRLYVMQATRNQTRNQ